MTPGINDFRSLYFEVLLEGGVSDSFENLFAEITFPN